MLRTTMIELSYVLASLRTSLPNVSKGCLPHDTMRNDKKKEKKKRFIHINTKYPVTTPKLCAPAPREEPEVD